MYNVYVGNRLRKVESYQPWKPRRGHVLYYFSRIRIKEKMFLYLFIYKRCCHLTFYLNLIETSNFMVS